MNTRSVHAEASIISSQQANDRTNPHTTARRHFADALVVVVAHEHVAAHIDSHANGTVEASVGPVRIGKIAIGAADPAGKR
jgi:hypothetical protein